MSPLCGAALLEQILALPSRDRDGWIDEELGFREPPPDLPLPRGAVPYLPSAVDDIVAMVREAPLGPDDVLVDLGSGEGRAVILAHLLSGALACGVEIQEPLVHAARARAAALELHACTFIHANAEDSVPDGSVYYLYAPFNGAMLLRVLKRLEEVARRSPIVVCTVDLILPTLPWLTIRSTRSLSVALHDSR